MDFLEDMSKIIIPLVLLAGAAYVAISSAKKHDRKNEDTEKMKIQKKIIWQKVCPSACAWVRRSALFLQTRWRSA